VITDPVTGNIIFADAKVGNTAEMFSKVRASIAVPGFLYGHQVKVNGGMYVDGATINMFPIRAAVERFQPTDVLIITNVLERERNRKKLRIAERLYKNIGLSRNSKEFREAFGMRWNFWSQGWDYFDSLPAKGIHTGTLWAPIEAGFFGERKKLLRKAGEMAMTETFDIFDEHSSQSSAEIMDEWKVK
jgi:predicted patatin/cPLA2 family phospholipase